MIDFRDRCKSSTIVLSEIDESEEILSFKKHQGGAPPTITEKEKEEEKEEKVTRSYYLTDYKEKCKACANGHCMAVALR